MSEGTDHEPNKVPKRLKTVLVQCLEYREQWQEKDCNSDEIEWHISNRNSLLSHEVHTLDTSGTEDRLASSPKVHLPFLSTATCESAVSLAI